MRSGGLQSEMSAKEKSEKVSIRKAKGFKNTGELWKQRSARNCESVRKDKAFNFQDESADGKAQ